MKFNLSFCIKLRWSPSSSSCQNEIVRFFHFFPPVDVKWTEEIKLKSRVFSWRKGQAIGRMLQCCHIYNLHEKLHTNTHAKCATPNTWNHNLHSFREIDAHFRELFCFEELKWISAHFWDRKWLGTAIKVNWTWKCKFRDEKSWKMPKIPVNGENSQFHDIFEIFWRCNSTYASNFRCQFG